MDRLHRKKKNNGFTLIEAIISTAVSMGIIALLTGSLFFFNTSSNQLRIQNDLQQNLRNASNRIQKELLPGRMVLSTYNGESSSDKKLFLSVPTLDSNGYPSTINGRDLQKNDVITLIQANNKVKFSLVPAAAGSSRKAINKQVLLSEMTNPYPVENGKLEQLFTYYSDNNQVLTGTNVEKAVMVKVVLWTGKVYGEKKLKEKEEINIRFRNFGAN